MILVTGSLGFLGNSVCNLLTKKNIPFFGTSQRLGVDLRNQKQTFKLFEEIKPKYVINCASFVGGIQFGLKHQAEIFSNNMKMSLNLLEAANIFKTKRIVNPISNCTYPGKASFFKEEEFWDGPLHESVMVYGMVRKAFWVGSYAYEKQFGMDIINLILSNMYGPGDHFEEERSHALGAIIMKIVEAKKNNIPEVIIWGSGKPVREWLYVDDGADALVRALDIPKSTDPINIGVGKGISILDLANLVKDIVGYSGKLVLDLSKADGAMYKTVDGSKGEKIFNWKPTKELREGIQETINYYYLKK